ncbi:MAG: DUF1624 domain-containing protein [Myxococcota bacterium]
MKSAEASESAASPSNPALSGEATSRRIAAIDWMRGFVMVLMAIDHASQMYNGGRVSADSAYLMNPETGGPAWIPGTLLDNAQFYTRWITHLCAPTFLFLSGTSLAMSLEKRRAEGMSESALDKHLLIRAGFVLAFEGVLTLLAGMGVLILQVLYAIGASMIAMVALRRLPTMLLLALGGGWLVGSEYILLNYFPIDATERSLFDVLFFVPGFASGVYVLYPMLHWLAMMLLGWAFGRRLLELGTSKHGRTEAEKTLLMGGMTSLLAWSFIRSQNVYGNMGLYRDDTTIVQFLHMSKYPPALTYTLMELGLMALILVVFMRFERRMTGPARAGNPLLVFGQTAFFFYILHFILLGGSAMAITGGMMLRGLQETYIAAAVTLVVLYPICLGFRALKKKHPRSLLQYI